MTEIDPRLGDVLDSGRQVDVGPDDTVHIYFASNGETWVDTGGVSRTSNGWNAYEQGRVEAVFEQISNVTGVNYVVTSSRSQADMVMGTSPLADGAVGLFYLPGDGQQTGMFDSTSGVYWSSAAGGRLDQGGVGFELLLHEIGHAFGLMHPHEGGAPGQNLEFPGIRPFFVGGNFVRYSYGDGDLNQAAYSVMSYNSGWATGPNGLSPSFDFGAMGSFGALDIAVLQDIYGVNETFASGDDNYALPTSNSNGSFYSTIWDTGGVDTISYSGGLNATINLLPASLLPNIGGGGYMSYVSGIHGGLTIAAGVQIENASGGAGNDLIIGNSGSNVLLGNFGNDTILDILGNSTLLGGSGQDTLSGGFDDADLDGGSGNDYLVGGIGNDTLEGGTGSDHLIGDPADSFLAGHDRLIGGEGADYLTGGAGGDTFVFAPGAGNDKIAQFDVNGTTMIGADFQRGIDHIELSGFSTVNINNVDSFLAEQGTNTVFSAEGTTITIFGVTGVTADDFIFV